MDGIKKLAANTKGAENKWLGRRAIGSMPTTYEFGKFTL
jgi:hypothetical protein